MTKEEMMTARAQYSNLAEYYQVLGFDHLQKCFEDGIKIIDAAIQILESQAGPAQEGE